MLNNRSVRGTVNVEIPVLMIFLWLHLGQFCFEMLTVVQIDDKHVNELESSSPSSMRMTHDLIRR